MILCILTFSINTQQNDTCQNNTPHINYVSPNGNFFCSSDCHYADCHYGKSHNAECHYTECHYQLTKTRHMLET